jgi:hypothetical protein
MIGDVAVMAMWAIACAIFGIIVALALARWAASRSVTARTVVATSASTLPVLGVAGFALALGGFPISVLSTSFVEFLVPFAMQLALIVAFSAPAIWLVSRRARKAPHLAGIFE